MWIPELAFTSSYGNHFTVVDERAIMMLLPETNQEKISLEESYEGHRLSGLNTSIILNRDYFHDFICEFEMQYYPFDIQVITTNTDGDMHIYNYLPFSFAKYTF